MTYLVTKNLKKRTGSKDFKQFINNDWKALNKTYKLTELCSYMREANKPVLVIWGIGFNQRPWTLRYANDVLNIFKNSKIQTHNTYLVAGVPSYWRTLQKDSKSHDRYIQNVTNPNILETEKLKIGYMPLVFPGLS